MLRTCYPIHLTPSRQDLINLFNWPVLIGNGSCSCIATLSRLAITGIFGISVKFVSDWYQTRLDSKISENSEFRVIWILESPESVISEAFHDHQLLLRKIWRWMTPITEYFWKNSVNSEFRILTWIQSSTWNSEFFHFFKLGHD